MEKVIYRTESHDGCKMEICVGTTNDLNPHRDIKELWFQISNENVQYDFELDEEELQGLINYLEDCKRYIKDFNKQSLEKAQTKTQ